MITFKLRTPYIELAQLLKASGIAESGGTAKQMIAAGEVLVDGTAELRKGRKVRSGQRVECAGQVITLLPRD